VDYIKIGLIVISKKLIVFCTVPDRDTAENISITLIKKGLAACCNILPQITSIYSWEGKIEKESELMLIIKSAEDKFSELEETITELHPYDVPEVIATEESV